MLKLKIKWFGMVNLIKLVEIGLFLLFSLLVNIVSRILVVFSWVRFFLIVVSVMFLLRMLLIISIVCFLIEVYGVIC